MTAAARAASAPAHTYVDTHCHLDMVLPRLELSFEDWRASLDATAHDDGATLDACITIGCSLKSLASTAELSQKQGVYSAFGIHPLSAPEWDGAGVPRAHRSAVRGRQVRRRGRDRVRLSSHQ